MDKERLREKLAQVRAQRKASRAATVRSSRRSPRAQSPLHQHGKKVRFFSAFISAVLGCTQILLWFLVCKDYTLKIDENCTNNFVGSFLQIYFANEVVIKFLRCVIHPPRLLI